MNGMIFKHGTPFHDLVIHRLNMLNCWSPMSSKQPPKGPSLDSAPKVHKSIILRKEIRKEKSFIFP